MTETESHIVDFTDLVPHRYENVLIDKVMVTGKGEGRFETTISTDDQRGRHMFLDNLGDENYVLARPVSLEILALAAVGVSGGISKDEMLFYAGISKVSFLGDMIAGVPISGEIKELGRKNRFVQYSGTIFQKDRLVGSAQIIAYLAENSSLDKGVVVNPVMDDTRNPKHRRLETMTLARDLSSITEDTCESEFIYPTTHPLNKGHFPTFPVMMGVMQVMALEELATLYMNHQNLPKGTYEVSGQGVLNLVENNELACNCQGLSFVYDNRGTIPYASLKSLKKLAFKQMILPGMSVQVCLKKLVIE